MKNSSFLQLSLFISIIFLVSASGSSGPANKALAADQDTNDIHAAAVETVLLTGVYIQDGTANLSTGAGTYSVPAAYDWNSDGRKDLLVGFNDPYDNFGYVRFYKNLGNDSSPAFNGYTLVKACNGSCDLSVTGKPGF